MSSFTYVRTDELTYIITTQMSSGEVATISNIIDTASQVSFKDKIPFTNIDANSDLPLTAVLIKTLTQNGKAYTALIEIVSVVKSVESNLEHDSNCSGLMTPRHAVLHRLLSPLPPPTISVDLPTVPTTQQ